MTVLVLSLVIVALLPPAIAGAIFCTLLYRVLQAAREARAHAAEKKRNAATKKP